MKHKLVLTTLACLIILGPLHFYSRNALFTKSSEKIPFTQRDLYTLPPSRVVQALFLNYSTFASSLSWIAGLLYFGDWRLSNTRTPPNHLQDYARLIRSLDHDFIEVYEWLNSTYLGSHHMPHRPVSYEDLELLRAFNQAGIEMHPDNWKLPYWTGMNYIGYSQDRAPQERLKEVDHAIYYLERCAMFASCPDIIPANISYFYQRRQELLHELQPDSQALEKRDTRDEVAFYKRLYPQLVDAHQRQSVARRLIELGVSEDELEQLQSAQIDQLQQRYESTRSYLPLDLWTQIVYPGADASQLIAAPKPLDDAM